MEEKIFDQFHYKLSDETIKGNFTHEDEIKKLYKKILVFILNSLFENKL